MDDHSVIVQQMQKLLVAVDVKQKDVNYSLTNIHNILVNMNYEQTTTNTNDYLLLALKILITLTANLLIQIQAVL